MPTKRHRVARVQRPEMSPAAIHLLMLGRHAPAGVSGWANLFWDMQPFDQDPVAWRKAILTPEIAAWLEPEAEAYAIAPWALAGRQPRGAGVAAWVHTFLAEHGRRP